ncbi:hypothetical protein C8R47DRAFT_422852 [Mycena vitilis]|nr:hypothetical protein C8R47DRAFT_422852 [Mycena vitilis]
MVRLMSRRRLAMLVGLNLASSTSPFHFISFSQTPSHATYSQSYKTQSDKPRPGLQHERTDLSLNLISIEPARAGVQARSPAIRPAP